MVNYFDSQQLFMVFFKQKCLRYDVFQDLQRKVF